MLYECKKTNNMQNAIILFSNKMLGKHLRNQKPIIMLLGITTRYYSNDKKPKIMVLFS